MKKLSLIIFTLLTLLSTVAAKHDAVQTTRFKGKGAEASFIFTEGCVTTQVRVAVNDQVQRQNGTTSPSSFAVVTVSQFSTPDNGADPETGEECPVVIIQESSGTFDDPDFTINRNLKEARLTGSGLLDDLSGQQRFVTFDIRWQGNGPITTEQFNDKITEGNVTIISKFKGRRRPAIAEGFVKEGDTNYIPGPAQGENTFLYQVRSGEITITRK